jgi:hypothetical protein
MCILSTYITLAAQIITILIAQKTCLYRLHWRLPPRGAAAMADHRPRDTVLPWAALLSKGLQDDTCNHGRTELHLLLRLHIGTGDQLVYDKRTRASGPPNPARRLEHEF